MPRPESDASPFGVRAPDAFATRVIGWTRRVPDGWLSRRFAFALRRLVTRRLDGAPLDVEAMGARFRLYPFNNVCEKRILFTPQYFDPIERAALASTVDEAVSAGLPFSFVDIGANVGGYSLFVAARGRGLVRVLAVEPQPVVFERLCFNIAANPGIGIKALQVAVADREGPLTMFLAARNRGESSVKVFGFEPGTGTSVTVHATTLEKLLRNEGFERIDAMKVDVEGAEDLVLVPFLRDVPAQRWPKLLVLANTPQLWHSDLHALLLAKGFAHRGTSRLKRLYVRDAATATTGTAAVASMPEAAMAQTRPTASIPAADARSGATP